MFKRLLAWWKEANRTPSREELLGVMLTDPEYIWTEAELSDHFLCNHHIFVPIEEMERGGVLTRTSYFDGHTEKVVIGWRVAQRFRDVKLN